MHSAVQGRGGAESTVFGDRGGKGVNLKGIQRLWAHPQYGPVLQVPGNIVIGSGLWLAGSDPESDKGAGGLEEDDEDPEQVGGKDASVRLFLQIRCTVGVALQCRNVGS